MPAVAAAVARRAAPGRAAEWTSLCVALAALAAVVLAYARLLHVTNHTIVALSFLLVVVATAATTTLRVATVASVVATLCFNFFFLPPTGTWTIADPQNAFALFTLLAVSVLVSRLATTARLREQDAVARRDELARLFDLTRDILLTAEASDPIAAIARHIVSRFRFARVSILRHAGGAWVEHAAGEPLGVPIGVLDALIDRGETARDLDRRPHARLDQAHATDGRLVWLAPLRIGTTTVGVLALQSEWVEPGTRDAIAGVVAIAIERQQLLDERREAELSRRSAELRSTLLASLSHDLRTPLTAVTVASSNLDAVGLSEAARRDQVDVIRTEVARLNRLFDNIVDMARIETHAITVEPEWVQVAEIIDTACQQVGREIAGHPLVVDVDERLMARVDPRLTSAALAHVVENAAQYSPKDSAIEIRGWAEARALRVSVRDHGRGIPADEMSRVFERFYRGSAGQERFGSGMGLAIVRGLIAAQGGEVEAENARAGGACVTMTVPADVRSVIESRESADQAEEDA